MMTKWFVWSPQGKVPSFEHPTFQNARIEAERLARIHPGQRFLVLQSVGECVKTDVQWTGHADDQKQFHESDLPF